MNVPVFIIVAAAILLMCNFAEAQSKSDTTFLDKVQRILEIRRSFEIESQAKNPALLSYKKSENSNSSVTIDLALSYQGWKYERWFLKPFVQVDFSGSSANDRNELLTTGISSAYYLFREELKSFRIQPDIFYTRDFFNNINIYRLALTFTPEFQKFFLPVADITKRKFSEESIDGKFIYALNPNVTVKLKKTDFDSGEQNLTDYFAAFHCDLAARHWYLQIVVSGLIENVFGESEELRYSYGATATLFFDEKERSSLNAKFEQKGSDILPALQTYTIGFGLKL